MKYENELIPFQCTPLPSGPWLVFAPHADDESFGMGGSLLLAAKQEIESHIVIMTNGALGAKDEHAALVEIRRTEAKCAAGKLAASSIIFLDEPDRGLTCSEELTERIARLIEKINPGSVFFPSPLELHPDHRATAQIVWQALKKITSFNGSAFAYDISIQGQINILFDITNVIDDKRALMAVYKSQLSENNYIQLVEALDRARTYTLPKETKAAEGFYRYEKVEGELSSYLTSTLSLYFDDNEDEKITLTKNEHDAQQKQIQNYQNEISQLKENYKRILNSTSWRVTQPLRLIKKALSTTPRNT